jgi:hypothetical protein
LEINQLIIFFGIEFLNVDFKGDFKGNVIRNIRENGKIARFFYEFY